MDKGAHFFCCDFQVHTPRDRNWDGLGGTADAERKQYAQDFVRAAKNKGLSAVAITDHHDMAFFPYIRKAANEESDADGNLIPAEKRLIVFPGMELTLAIPCQALLLFDAEFPEDLIPLAYSALAITPSNPADEYCAEVTRLDDVTTFDRLHELLDRHAYLKGRYIVIPNVSEGGSSTLLRSGHASHYRQMPCVAGYLDGSISQLGDGNTRILNGLNRDYGHKPLGIFQTSDNRSRDFRDLGEHKSWLKWAQPTAEALRQACLARESRISQTEPLLPSIAITSINISNSAFLGPLHVEFNPQYNAIIGGRGTGKSTLLEYLRWSLCDEPAFAEDELPGYQAKRDKLVKQTLTDLKANIQIDFLVNGVSHSVRRNAATNELLLKISGGTFEPCKPEDIRTLLPIQAYSQKQLSNVGVRLDELNRFILSPIRREVSEIEARLRELASEQRKAFLTLQQSRQLQNDIGNDEKLITSLNEQIQAGRKELTGIGEQEQAILSKKTGFDREAEVLAAWATHIQNAQTSVASLKQSLTRDSTDEIDLEGLPNRSEISNLQQQLDEFFQTLNRGADQLQAEISKLEDSNHPLVRVREAIIQKHHEFETSYEAAKAKSTAHASKLEGFNALEQQQRAARARLTSKKAELIVLGAPEAKFAELRNKWREAQNTRSSLLDNQCRNLTTLSENQIRATLKKGFSTDDVAAKIKTVLTGTAIRSSKLDTLLGSVGSAPAPLQAWEAVLFELEALMLVAARSPNTFVPPPTPTLTSAGFSSGDLEKLARKLSHESWIEVAVTPLKDAPVFEYRVRESEYIAFSDASAGQQATALLWVLLNQPGPPLVIDQPEDDLDNKVMPQTAEKLWAAKRRRQLIFSSHNANLVVNGDADLVVCCDYRVAGEQSGGTVKLQGAIDVKEVRDEIAAVMEGGREAFKLRKDKYGF